MGINKNYLDSLYKERFDLINKIKYIDKELEGPQSICKKCNSSSDQPLSIKKSGYQDAIQVVDRNISEYLKFHR